MASNNSAYGNYLPSVRCEMYLENGSGKARDDTRKYHGKTVVSCEVNECPYGNLRFDGVCIGGGLVDYPGLFKRLEQIAKS